MLAHHNRQRNHVCLSVCLWCWCLLWALEQSQMIPVELVAKLIFLRLGHRFKKPSVQKWDQWKQESNEVLVIFCESVILNLCFWTPHSTWIWRFVSAHLLHRTPQTCRTGALTGSFALIKARYKFCFQKIIRSCVNYPKIAQKKMQFSAETRDLAGNDSSFILFDWIVMDIHATT